MRINIEALKRAGWQVDFDVDTGIIDIYSERGSRIDMSHVEEQLHHVQGLMAQDIHILLDNFVDEVHARQVWSSIRATQFEEPQPRKKGFKKPIS